jgi:hypothetical protein
MSNTKFNHGDTVYNLDGQQGAYIASYGGNGAARKLCEALIQEMNT